MCCDPFDFLTDQGRKRRWEGGHAPLPCAPPFFWKIISFLKVPTMILMKDLGTFYREVCTQSNFEFITHVL